MFCVLDSGCRSRRYPCRNSMSPSLEESLEYGPAAATLAAAFSRRRLRFAFSRFRLRCALVGFVALRARPFSCAAFVRPRAQVRARTHKVSVEVEDERKKEEEEAGDEREKEEDVFSLGSGEFLRALWRAVAPLMAPWCTDGEVPTCATGGSGSRVRWHSDDEGLFGERRESSGNLGLVWIVKQALPGCTMVTFLVMDGCCQDEYLHCTEPLQGGERVNITFRWIRNHVLRYPLAAGVVCCLPTCAKGFTRVVLLALLGWGLSFLVALFSPCLELRCRLRAATGCVAGCGASLVDAVLDRTLGVSNSVGAIWGILYLGFSGCEVH